MFDRYLTPKDDIIKGLRKKCAGMEARIKFLEEDNARLLSNTENCFLTSESITGIIGDEKERSQS